MKCLIRSFLCLVFLSACSTAERGGRPDLDDSDSIERVVSRLGSAAGQPQWLDDSRGFWIEGGEVFTLGRATLPGDGRIEMGYRIAENNAKTALAAVIEQRLHSIFQAAEEGTGLETSQYRRIGTEVTRLVSSSLRPKSRYWEKVLTRDASGSKMLRLDVYAVVSMPDGDFRSAVLAAIRRNSGEKGVSADLASRAAQEWDLITAKPPKSVLTAEGQ